MGLPKSAGNPDGTSNFQNAALKETTDYTTNTIRIDHVINPKQRFYGRVSWYDRNSDYNNYFDNLSTGEVFTFTSRQVAFDHVVPAQPHDRAEREVRLRPLPARHELEPGQPRLRPDVARLPVLVCQT